MRGHREAPQNLRGTLLPKFRNSRNSFRITSLADPHTLTPIKSHRCEKARGGGFALGSSSILPLRPASGFAHDIEVLSPWRILFHESPATNHQPLSLLFATHPRNRPLSPLLATLPKTRSRKSFVCHPSETPGVLVRSIAVLRHSSQFLELCEPLGSQRLCVIFSGLSPPNCQL